MEQITLDVGIYGTTQSGGYWENMRTVEFKGEYVASYTDSDDRGNRGITETLYRTADARLVVYRKDWSRWQGENTRTSLIETCDAELDIDGPFEMVGRKAGMTRTLSLDEALE